MQSYPSGWGFLDIPGASHVEKGERRRSNDMYELLLLLLLYVSYTWYEVRRCAFDRRIGHENVAVVRSSAVHQPHTHTP